MLCVVIALAGPGRPQTQVARTGHGAEVIVLMDRSRSMDLRMMPSDWRTIDPIIRTQQA
jgi:mxaC protein